MKIELALGLCKLTKYAYYKKLGKRRKAGRKPSTITPRINEQGVLVEASEEEVIQKITSTLLMPETCYGYRAMSVALQHQGFLINHKKVYRLMSKYVLLRDQKKRPARNYVKYRRVSPTRPLEVLEMDIKFQFVTEHKQYAFILTVIDCFTRKALYWTVAYSIKQAQIKAVWEQIIVQYLQPEGLLEKELTLELRNDNETRFTAKDVQEYFKDNHINQVFTHPYTPQENGHIESFHAILGRSLEFKEYGTLNDLNQQLEHFYHHYNNIRLHGSLSHLNPSAFIELWQKNYIKIEPHKSVKYKYQIKLLIPHYRIKPNGEIRPISEESQYEINRRYRTQTALNAQSGRT